MEEIKVTNCHNCPFVYKHFIKGSGSMFQISCNHKDTLNEGSYFKLLAYHNDSNVEPTIKHEIFEECPLKTNSFLILLSGENDSKLPKEINGMIDELVAMYPDMVSRGGKNKTIEFVSGNPTYDDIIVFEAGVRGPADWFYYKEGKFYHGAYTGYKESYTIVELAYYINNVNKNNIKYHES
ncbi:MAG: hypothetical protein WC979_02460 [Candidatus Pacearchaeota archaeon]|jgi:hypothetical protein|nr:hypothetical protein [Clostridia bacterium]